MAEDTSIILNKTDPSELEVSEILNQFDTSGTIGLSSEEAAERLKKYGHNILKETEKASWFAILINQFTSILIWILIVAALLSYFVGEVGDTITIVAIVVLNGILGFLQEWKAEQALEALRNMLAPKCVVLRNSRRQEIDAATVVAGDISILKSGDKVPADIRIIECSNLRADESSLTGEVNPVNKSTLPAAENTPLSEKNSMVWMGTIITEGLGKGVVVATGMNTEFGKIAELTQSVEKEETPLQKRFATLGRQLGILSIAVSVIVGLLGWIEGKPATEMLMTAISLAVAVVPEGLPAVVTITLALGIRGMVKKNALIRKLQATETLGSTSVICTDKTGTLTKNEMTVQKIYLMNKLIDVTGLGYDPEGHFKINGEKISYQQQPDLIKLLRTGLYCNHAEISLENKVWNKIGEPTEAALITAAYKAWINNHKDKPEIIKEYPFSSERKRMSVLSRENNSFSVMTKGAPEVILKRCTSVLDNGQRRKITEEDIIIFENAFTEMAKDGLRTLAIAGKDIDNINIDVDEAENELTLFGVVGIIDPPRDEVAPAIKLTKTAGIKTIMITGDSPVTAAAIAARIGLPGEKVITGTELDSMTDEELAAEVKGQVIFARTTPSHKLRIVSALQKLGHVVSMTGDGVNDAPALKKADIGIAMGIRGTDVAKGASEMILLDDNYASILNAIEEGRRQYSNIQKFVRYLLSSNTGEIVALFVNIAMNAPLILLPVQILWMNLITDGVTALSLGLEPVEKGSMNLPPRPPEEKILTKKSMIGIILLGLYMGTATLIMFNLTLHKGEDYARTIAFTGIIILEKANIFNFRSFDSPLSKIGFFSNKWLLTAVSLMFVIQIIAVYTPFFNKMLHTVPLHTSDWLLMLSFALPLFIVPELVKIFRYKSVRKEKFLL